MVKLPRLPSSQSSSQLLSSRKLASLSAPTGALSVSDHLSHLCLLAAHPILADLHCRLLGLEPNQVEEENHCWDTDKKKRFLFSRHPYNSHWKCPVLGVMSSIFTVPMLDRPSLKSSHSIPSAFCTLTIQILIPLPATEVNWIKQIMLPSRICTLKFKKILSAQKKLSCYITYCKVAFLNCEIAVEKCIALRDTTIKGFKTSQPGSVRIFTQPESIRQLWGPTYPIQPILKGRWWFSIIIKIKRREFHSQSNKSTFS